MEAASPKRRTLVAPLLASAVLAVGAWGCQQNHSPAPGPGGEGRPGAPRESEPIANELAIDRDTQITKAEATTRTIRVPVTGEFKPIRRAEIATAEMGYVVGLGPKESRLDGIGELRVGTFVPAGSLLVELANLPLEAELIGLTHQIEQLKISVNGVGDGVPSELAAVKQTAESNMKRLESLAQSRAVPAAQLDEARAAYARAAAAMATSRAALDGLLQQKAVLTQRVGNLMVRAPFAGRIAEVRCNVGQRAGNDPVVVLIDDAELEYEFTVPESFAPFVRIDETRVMPNVPDFGELVITGMAPAISPVSRSLTVFARFKNPPRDAGAPTAAPRKIKVGAFATGDLLLSVPGVFVRADALRQRESQSVAFVLTDENTIEERPVQRGISGDGFVQVIANLRGGESIVIAAAVPGVRAGANVRFESAAPSTEAISEGRGNGR